MKRKHLIENWCNLLGIEYTNQYPVLNFNLVQQRLANMWKREKPVLVIQTNGGPFNSGLIYSWTRDIPFDVALLIAEKYSKTHHIIQVCKPSSRKLPNVEVLEEQMSSMEMFLLLAIADKRILIDSCLQHAAAALNVESDVFWIGTSPKNFGYVLHNNIVANPPTNVTKMIDSYLFDYSFDGVTHECPYFTIEEMFNVSEIIKNI
jgi:hypothetical protein